MPKYRRRNINIGRMPNIANLPFILAVGWIGSMLVGLIFGLVTMFSISFFASFNFFFIAVLSYFFYYFLSRKYGEFVAYRMTKKQIRHLKPGNINKTP